MLVSTAFFSTGNVVVCIFTSLPVKWWTNVPVCRFCCLLVYWSKEKNLNCIKNMNWLILTFSCPYLFEDVTLEGKPFKGIKEEVLQNEREWIFVSLVRHHQSHTGLVLVWQCKGKMGMKREIAFKFGFWSHGNSLEVQPSSLFVLLIPDPKFLSSFKKQYIFSLSDRIVFYHPFHYYLLFVYLTDLHFSSENCHTSS